MQQEQQLLITLWLLIPDPATFKIAAYLALLNCAC